jgi:hypothetical protein
VRLKVRGNKVLREHSKLALGAARLEGIDHQKKTDGQIVRIDAGEQLG